MNARSGTPYYRYLDGLRCFSVFWVILIHLKLHGGRAFEFVAGHGWMGVDMFFVISGFLITSLLLREHERTGGISLGRFYARRILRIWPAYYLLLGILVALALLGLAPSMTLSTIKWPLMYLTNAYAGYHRTETVAFLPSWSLSLEEQFYLLWPLLLFVSVKRARLIAILAIATVTTWRTWLTFHLVPGVLTMRRIFYAPDTRIDVILYGCLLAYILADAASLARVRRLLDRRATPFALAAAFVVVVYINNRWSGHIGNAFGYTLGALSMAGIIAYLHTVKPAVALRVLESRPVVYVGRISYGMYLFQPFIITDLRRHFGSAPRDPLEMLLIALLAYAVTIITAGISYRFFESPFLRLKERFSSPRNPPARLLVVHHRAVHDAE